MAEGKERSFNDILEWVALLFGFQVYLIDPFVLYHGTWVSSEFGLPCANWYLTWNLELIVFKLHNAIFLIKHGRIKQSMTTEYNE